MGRPAGQARGGRTRKGLQRPTGLVCRSRRRPVGHMCASCGSACSATITTSHQASSRLECGCLECCRCCGGAHTHVMGSGRVRYLHASSVGCLRLMRLPLLLEGFLVCCMLIRWPRRVGAALCSGPGWPRSFLAPCLQLGIAGLSLASSSCVVQRSFVAFFSQSLARSSVARWAFGYQREARRESASAAVLGTSLRGE